MTMTPEKAQALLALRETAKAFIGVCKAAGNDGAPGGVMYAASMGVMRLDQFEKIMSGLCDAGYLRKSGEHYFWVKDLK